MPDHPNWHEWDRDMTRVNGVDVHYVAAGDPDDPLVLLLHGFPEFWYAWRHQLPALADAGYHVVAPDLRGYNESGKPSGTEQYRVDRLVDDVVALVSDFGHDDAAVVAHDWGGIVGWETAIRCPEVVRRLAVLNAPHPGAYLRELRRGREQWMRSWYAFLFQLPTVPEWMLSRNDYESLEGILRGSAPDAFSREDVERYKVATAKRGALTAALNYYRAGGSFGDPLTLLKRLVPSLGRDTSVDVPTLVLWGERDTALVPELADVERWVDDLRVERYPEVSHWIQAEIPEAVNEELAGFLD